ncbi:hypothetical protein COO60DRAFT_21464 [Scenedesmus sp. NREL 46B-D3]|nr:hypothetical protein COO60DRAFT_21464 [Scenedesmus sp. NREL 46B-D3]
MEPMIYDQERLKLFEGALQALLSTLQPSTELDAARRLVVAEMQQLVAESLPGSLHCSVETFGSFRAGLHLPGSDLDFAVNAWVTHTVPVPGTEDGFGGQQQHVAVEAHEWPAQEQQYLLADLADALEAKGLVQGQVERVLHARVPVIKCVHAATGLSCDFSVSRPECAFKAEMQKLWGTLDRRYAALYRLVKAWAAAHGVNDAASNTLNSWSWGLMVAFYLQSEQPAVLPPLWQMLEQRQPRMGAPRVLQGPGASSAALKRTLNVAMINSAAYVSKRAREGSSMQNHKGLAELLAGFFEVFGEQMARWSQGRQRSNTRCSPWWGSWVDATWPGNTPYIFSVEDPFNSGDNTARSVGSHNHLSCTNSARYIAWAVNTSAQLLREALGGKPAADAATPTAAAAAGVSADTAAGITPMLGGMSLEGTAAAAAPGSPGVCSLADWLGSANNNNSSSAASCAEPACQRMLSAFAWLFGPPAVLQLSQRSLLPVPLLRQVDVRLPPDELSRVAAEAAGLGDCWAALANSSSLSCPDSKNRCLADPLKVQQIQRALRLFRRLMQGLEPQEQQQQLCVCMGDFLEWRRQHMQQLWQQQQAQQGLQELRVGSAPSDLQPQQRQRQQQQRRSQPKQQQQQQHGLLGATSAVANALAAVGALRPASGAPMQGASGGSSSSTAGMPRRARSVPAAAGLAASEQQQDAGSSTREHRPPPAHLGGSSSAARGRGRGRGGFTGTRALPDGSTFATVDAGEAFLGGAGHSRWQQGRVGEGGHHQQQQQQHQQQQQQQRGRPPRGGVAAVALSQAGLTGSSSQQDGAGQQQQQDGRGLRGGGGRHGSNSSRQQSGAPQYRSGAPRVQPEFVLLSST